MSEIRANSITDAAGTGAPNFPVGVKSQGANIATETIMSSSAPSLPVGGTWYDTASLKTYQRLQNGSWFELITNPSSPPAVTANNALTGLPGNKPANQTLAVVGTETSVYQYNAATDKWNYVGLPLYRWEGTGLDPRFVSLRGQNTGDISGVYTPTSGCLSFHVMMWGSTGHGGNNVGYSNLQTALPISAAGGRAYSERLVTHSAGATYAYVLGNAAALYATGVGAGFRSYAGTTTFNWGGGVMSCTGTGNPSATGGVASGGTFNANGAFASGTNGGGSGSRAGAGQANGSNGGLVEAAGVVPINFKGFRGFNFNPSPAVGSVNTGTSPYASSGKPWFGGQNLTAYEQSFVTALSFLEPGAFPTNTYGAGTTSHILILEYFQ
jgi:hypothetical protein